MSLEKQDPLMEKLKQVAIPGDLKARLLAIPESSEDHNSTSVHDLRTNGNGTRFGTWLWMALAASLIAIVAVLSVGGPGDRLADDPNGSALENPTTGESPGTEGNPVIEGRAELEGGRELAVVGAEELLSGFHRECQEIEQLSLRWQVLQMRQRVQQARRQRPELTVSGQQSLSIASCYSQLAQLDWGREKAELRPHLQLLIEQFPETVGASIAQRVLSEVP